jgi:hypothetical protein
MGYGDIAIPNPNRLKLVLRNAHPHVSVTITTVKIIFFSLYPSIITVLFSSCKNEYCFGSVFLVCLRLFYLFPVLKSLSFLPRPSAAYSFTIHRRDLEDANSK